MKDTIHFGASAIFAALLVLASCVLDGPLLAVVVAMLAAGAAWISAHLACRQLHLAALEQQLTGAASQRHFGA